MTDRTLARIRRHITADIAARKPSITDWVESPISFRCQWYSPLRSEYAISLSMTRLIIATTALVLFCAACSSKPVMRDTYWGRSFLEPGREPETVRHDKHGNAVLKDRRRRDGGTDPTPGTDAVR